MNSKSIFASKTAVVNFLIAVAGVIAFFKPEVKDAVKDNAVAILMGIGAVNVALRLVTHGKVTLFAKED